MRVLLALLIVLAMPVAALAAQWQRYIDPEYGYTVDIPDDGFDIEADAERNGLTVFERDGRGQIDVYAIRNDEGLSLETVRDTLAGADRIREVTYSRGGRTWFVLSGYYNRLNDDATDLIFYAKYMFAPDGHALSAFEASYPVADKKRYDPIIEHIEDSLSAPKR